MKFSKKFKNILFDFTNETSHLVLPSSSIYKEDYTMRNRLCDALFNPSSCFTEDKLNEYSDFRFAYSFYDNQDIYFIIYLNAATSNHCLFLAYRNQKSYYKVFKSFFINVLDYDYDTLFSSICSKNKLYICKDYLQLFKNLKIVA